MVKMRLRLKTIVVRIKTPADTSAIEGALLKAAHAGHWHDAEVRVDGDEILVSYRDGERIVESLENRVSTEYLTSRDRTTT